MVRENCLMQKHGVLDICDGRDSSAKDIETARALYRRARSCAEAGKPSEAMEAYLHCVELDPDHAEAHHDLGILSAQAGQDEEAARRFQRAIALNPFLAEAHDGLLTVLARSGRCVEAAEAGRAAVASCPDSVSARLRYGEALEAVGDLSAAAASFRCAIRIDPGSIIGSLKLANTLRRLGELDDALEQAARTIALSPGHHGARIIRGLILDGLNRHDEAGTDYATAAELCPPAAEALNFLGVICIDQGRFEIAGEVLRRSVLLDPGKAEPHGNLGLALQRQGRIREAFDACVKAVTIDPRNVQAQCNLSGLLIGLGQFDAAVAACRLAVQFDPVHVEAYLYLGIALRRLGRLAEALTAFRQAQALRPESAEALIEICDIRQQTCDWPGIEAEQQAALDQSCGSGRRVPPFQVLALTGSSLEHLRAARLWSAGFRRRTEPLATYTPRPPGRRTERLRVGYLSADFRTHATAMLVAELFECHDRQLVSLFGYSCGEDDGSPMRRRLVGALDRFADIRPLSHSDAARQIHADGIDILVDLKGYTRDARPEILVHRPASIQVNFLGYPGTMGADFVDYIIADRFVAPFDAAGAFEEKLVHLPHCYQPNDRLRAVAAERPSRRQCGLPEEAFVFCCLNNSYKITPQLFDIWMRLLGGLPGSVLWLLDGDGPAAANLRREARARGIDGERLVFAPKVLPELHLARLALADLFLDTLPVNAHTTASEALWAGLPLVTCAGEAFVSRVAGSLLNAVGLPDLVTASLGEYEALAMALARDPPRLSSIRRRLVEGRDDAPLFETERYTRNFEAALLRMAELRDLGRAPEAFAVEDCQSVPSRSATTEP